MIENSLMRWYINKKDICKTAIKHSKKVMLILSFSLISNLIFMLETITYSIHMFQTYFTLLSTLYCNAVDKI